MRARPIRVRCVGSGCPPVGWPPICTMCGVPKSRLEALHEPEFHDGNPEDDALMPEHERDDILAMIDRGDFGPVR